MFFCYRFWIPGLYLQHLCRIYYFYDYYLRGKHFFVFSFVDLLLNRLIVSMSGVRGLSLRSRNGPFGLVVYPVVARNVADVLFEMARKFILRNSGSGFQMELSEM